MRLKLSARLLYIYTDLKTYILFIICHGEQKSFSSPAGGARNE